MTLEKLKTPELSLQDAEAKVEQDTEAALTKLRKEVLAKKPKAKEQLSDPIELAQVEDFIIDVNKYIASRKTQNKIKGAREVYLKNNVWDDGQSFELSLKKNGKVVLTYSYLADMTRTGNPISMHCKVNGRMLNYTSDGKKGKYDHYEVLAQAKKYMQEVESIIK